MNFWRQCPVKCCISRELERMSSASGAFSFSLYWEQCQCLNLPDFKKKPMAMLTPTSTSSPIPMTYDCISVIYHNLYHQHRAKLGNFHFYSFSPVSLQASNQNLCGCVCVCGRNELEVCTMLAYPHTMWSQCIHTHTCIFLIPSEDSGPIELKMDITQNLIPKENFFH